MLSAQDPLLKLGAQFKTNSIKGEMDVFASQECHNLVCDETYLSAGGTFGIRKVCLDKPLSREPCLRQQDTANPRLFSMD